MFLFKMKNNFSSYRPIKHNIIFQDLQLQKEFIHFWTSIFTYIFFLISPLFINVNIMSSDPKIILCRVEVMKSRALDNI